MALNKRTYVDGETVITAENLNDIQDEVIANAAAVAGAIPAPQSPASGAFLVWNGSAWAAQTLAVWQGGNY